MTIKLIRIGHSAVRTRIAACVLFLSSIAASAAGNEIQVQNDSLTNGQSGTRCACFVPDEQVAAWLDSPCDGGDSGFADGMPQLARGVPGA